MDFAGLTGITDTSEGCCLLKAGEEACRESNGDPDGEGEKEKEPGESPNCVRGLTLLLLSICCAGLCWCNNVTGGVIVVVVVVLSAKGL